MHCHLPLGIFNHVSVQRSFTSRGFPDASVPLPLKPPVAIAVSPNTVTFRSLYSALSYLVAFAVASVSTLPVTFPSLPVFTNLSARIRTSTSGLFVFCDCNHCCSSSATAFSVPPVVWACDRAALPSESRPIKHHIQILFIDFSLFVAICKILFGGPVGCA